MADCLSSGPQYVRTSLYPPPGSPFPPWLWAWPCDVLCPLGRQQFKNTWELELAFSSCSWDPAASKRASLLRDWANMVQSPLPSQPTKGQLSIHVHAAILDHLATSQAASWPWRQKWVWLRLVKLPRPEKLSHWPTKVFKNPFGSIYIFSLRHSFLRQYE